MSKQQIINRRDFLQMTAMAAVAAQSALHSVPAMAQPKGQRPKNAGDVTVLNPQNRVPVSLIIDDSTCLVNMAHFGIPHFATAWPDKYKQDWRSLPRGKGMPLSLVITTIVFSIWPAFSMTFSIVPDLKPLLFYLPRRSHLCLTTATGAAGASHRKNSLDLSWRIGLNRMHSQA